MRDHGDGPRAEVPVEPETWPEAAAPGGSVSATKPAKPVQRLWFYFLLLVMGMVWGGSFSLAKLATEGGAHPLGLSLWQGLLGGALLFAFCLARRKLPQINRRHAGFYLVCGLLGTVLPSTLFFYAAPHVPAGILAITVAVVPILTYAISLPLKADVMTRGRAAGILLGMVSIVLLVAPGSSLPSRDMVPWVLIALLAAAFYAAENMYIALRRPPGSDALAIVAGMLFMAALMLAPVVAATGSFVPLAPPWGVVEWSIVGMVLANALAYTLFIQVVTSAGPVFASQTAYIVTIAGVFWGMVIFGEQHSLWIWAALAVMLAGLTLVTPRKGSGGDHANDR